MCEKDAAIFVFRVLIQILILSGKKICKCEAEKSDRARIQIFLAWIDDDGFACRERLDVLNEEVEAEKKCAAGRFVEEIAVEAGEPPDGSGLADLVVVIRRLTVGNVEQIFEVSFGLLLVEVIGTCGFERLDENFAGNRRCLNFLLPEIYFHVGLQGVGCLLNGDKIICLCKNMTGCQCK